MEMIAGIIFIIGWILVLLFALGLCKISSGPTPKQPIDYVSKDGDYGKN